MLKTFSLLGLLFFACGLKAQLTNNGGTITIEDGANLICKGDLINMGRISGTPTVEGSFLNSGTLASGNASGILAVKGNYAAQAMAVQNVKVAGTTSGSYNQLNVSGNVQLNGTLNVTLSNGFLPSGSDPDLRIITGTINGKFATVTIPTQYLLVYNSNSVVLRSLRALAVTFINVEVQREGSGARVFWNMQNEANVSYYEVEKSPNGRNFAKAGEVKAILLSRYSFLDSSPDPRTYYRIKSVGSDSKYSYSAVVTYNQGKSSVGLNVFPSPAMGLLQVQHTAARAGSRIVIVSMDGKAMQTIHPAGGTQVTVINVSALSTGTYLLRFDNGNAQPSETIKFVKR